MIRTKRSFIIGILAASQIAPASDRAAVTFTATLGGSQEVPTVTPAASGAILVNFNQYQDLCGPVFLMDLQASISGLSSGWTFAGLYGPAGFGKTGPLVMDIAAVSGPTPPSGATSGSFGVMNQQLTPPVFSPLRPAAFSISLSSE